MQTIHPLVQKRFAPDRNKSERHDYLCMKSKKYNLMKNEFIRSLSKEKLIQLLEDYSKNWLAMDGVWFQSVEQTRGMDEAMHHDAEAWRRYTLIEAMRIKQFLNLPEHPGLEGLALALQLRFYANLNEADLFGMRIRLPSPIAHANVVSSGPGNAKECRFIRASR